MKSIIKLLFLFLIVGYVASQCVSKTEKNEIDRSDLSDLKTCPIHNTRYSEKNIYSGCPKCAQKRNEENAEKARQRASHL